ncbi:MAG: polysaccharide deacetylase family protein [Lentisphaeria bacterium]|nr:glycoside hydrolase family 57 protein [Lentisphaeria bacterium]NQZ67776.1 polysaccharide deacetylase family protein [Lentisphaeria bacterium]
MISVCLYFQVHQPKRLRHDYRFFNIGDDPNYENSDLNRGILRKVANSCYLPSNAILLELINKLDGQFKVCFSLSGTFLEQCENDAPDVLESFQKLVATGCVELLNETYYHSLAFHYSKKEFREQVELHRKKIKELFDYEPTAFRNTELILDNKVAAEVEKMGYDVVLTEGANRILGWRTPNFVYQAKESYKLKLLLRNFKLSDDLSFRFSDVRSPGYPVTAEKYAASIQQVAGNGEVVNIFMDYETFGEHQWAESGIHEFLKHLPHEVLKYKNMNFKTPTEIAKNSQPVAKIDMPNPVSWADLERDLTAWRGNSMQDSSLENIYALEKKVMKSKDPELIDCWRNLQTSDHFYYMCTKWFSDGDVHRYFNPYGTPHEAYIVYSNVLNDLIERVKSLDKEYAI